MTEAVRNQSTLSKSISEYLDFLEFTSHSSPLTVRNYTHYLQRFSNFLSGKIKDPTVRDISESLIGGYKSYLSGLGLSPKTLGFHLIAVRGFLKWKVKLGEAVLGPERVEIPKAGGSKMDFLSGAEVDKLLSAPNTTSIRGKRDRAIIELFYSTGLRVSELASLNRDNIDYLNKKIVIYKNGKKVRIIFLPLRVLECIENYLKPRKDKFKSLFIRHKGKSGKEDEKRLTVRSIQRMIKKYGQETGLGVAATPKTLRASFATDLLMAGADLRSVQEMLGHKNVSTTQIYTHVTNKQLKDIHESFHGRGH